jgi:tetratricopeptide (TPR) repeat protein
LTEQIVSKQKQPSRNTAPRRAGVVVAVPFLLIIGARVVASLYPHGMLWGLNFQGFLGDGITLPVMALAVIAAIPAVADALHPAVAWLAERLFPEQRAKSILIHTAVAVGFGVCCRLLFIPFPFLGDGVHVARALFRYNAGAGLAYGTLWMEPGSVLVYNTIIKLVAPASPVASGVDISQYSRVFMEISYALGAVYLFGVLRLSSAVTTAPPRRLAVVSGILGCAGILFYFGYVEFYAFLYLFGTLFLLSAMREVRLPGFPRWTTILLAAGAAFHLSALMFLPVYGLTIWLWGGERGREEESATIPTRTIAAAVGGFLAAAFIVYLVLNLTGNNHFFIALTSDKGYLSLFSAQHVMDVLNNLALHAPVALALLALAMVMRGRLQRAAPGFWIAATSAVLWAALCWSHSAIARDWDVYALLGVSLALAGTWIAESIREQHVQRYAVVQLVVQPLLLVIPWIGINASFERSLERYSAITESYVASLPPEVSLGHLETLRSAYVASGQSEGEILTIARGLQIQFDPYECYKLARAFESARALTPRMTAAAQSAEEMILSMPDSLLAKPVGQSALAGATSLYDVYFNLARAVTRLLPPKNKPAFAEMMMTPLYEKQRRRFDIGAYIGSRYFDIQQYDQSLRWYERALLDTASAGEDKEVTLPSVFHGLGIIHAKRNDPQRSLASFRRAVSYARAGALTWSDYGFACYQFAQYQEAVPPLAQALRMDSTDANALYCLGRIYAADPSRHPTGVSLLKKFLTVEPNSPRADNARGVLAGTAR